MGRGLTHVDRLVLRALTDSATPAERTVEAIARRTAVEEGAVRTALIKLEAEGAVHSEMDGREGPEYWTTGGEALGPLERQAPSSSKAERR